MGDPAASPSRRDPQGRGQGVLCIHRVRKPRVGMLRRTGHKVGRAGTCVGLAGSDRCASSHSGQGLHTEVVSTVCWPVTLDKLCTHLSFPIYTKRCPSPRTDCNLRPLPSSPSSCSFVGGWVRGPLSEMGWGSPRAACGYGSCFTTTQKSIFLPFSSPSPQLQLGISPHTPTIDKWVPR